MGGHYKKRERKGEKERLRDKQREWKREKRRARQTKDSQQKDQLLLHNKPRAFFSETAYTFPLSCNK